MAKPLEVHREKPRGGGIFSGLFKREQPKAEPMLSTARLLIKQGKPNDAAGFLQRLRDLNNRKLLALTPEQQKELRELEGRVRGNVVQFSSRRGSSHRASPGPSKKAA